MDDGVGPDVGRGAGSGAAALGEVLPHRRQAADLFIVGVDVDHVGLQRLARAGGDGVEGAVKLLLDNGLGHAGGGFVGAPQLLLPPGAVQGDGRLAGKGQDALLVVLVEGPRLHIVGVQNAQRLVAGPQGHRLDAANTQSGQQLAGWQVDVFTAHAVEVFDGDVAVVGAGGHRLAQHRLHAAKEGELVAGNVAGHGQFAGHKAAAAAVIRPDDDRLRAQHQSRPFGDGLEDFGGRALTGQGHCRLAHLVQFLDTARRIIGNGRLVDEQLHGDDLRLGEGARRGKQEPHDTDGIPFQSDRHAQRGAEVAPEFAAADGVGGGQSVADGQGAAAAEDFHRQTIGAHHLAEVGRGLRAVGDPLAGPAALVHQGQPHGVGPGCVLGAAHDLLQRLRHVGHLHVAGGEVRAQPVGAGQRLVIVALVGDGDGGRVGQGHQRMPHRVGDRQAREAIVGHQQTNGHVARYQRGHNQR